MTNVTDIESVSEITNPVAYPPLSDAQIARLRSYGTPQTVNAGEVLYGPGDTTYDLIVTEDAIVEIVQPTSGPAHGWCVPSRTAANPASIRRHLK